MKVSRVSEMRELDRTAIEEFGIDTLILAKHGELEQPNAVIRVADSF